MNGHGLLYLLDYADLGGGETSFLEFVAELRRQAPGLPVACILASAGPLGHELMTLGASVYRINYPLQFRRGLIPLFDWRAARQICDLVTQLRPALVHANNVFGLLYGGHAARRARLPLVWTCHGAYDIDTRLKQLIARRHADHIFCVSTSVRDAVLQAIPLATRSSVDYLGIAPRQDAAAEDPGQVRHAVRREMNVGDATPLAGVIARFQPIKGHQYLLDALPAVWRSVPDLKLWFIGDALFGREDEMRHKSHIERRVRDETEGDQIRFLGFRGDARRLLRALDLLVIPSEAESFSMVAAEALEAGIPVIGPHAGGPAEIIESPAMGLHFEPKNSSDLADKMIALLTRSGPGAAFDCAAGPRRFAACFTARAHVQRALAKYAELAPALAAFHQA